ncbi:hypothetical protein EV182_000770 [Spiromyces aspiralis]|uniref:Uncharacterized protein n=1 Tax=Spiromyces aspiralis TaxID=68401 RepID=A0ACC1I039_9FUNG|nr:hypothetical protein EV182_000770 [Spiromyces aspiralis]
MAPTQHGGSKVPHRQDQNLQQHKPGPARLYWGTDKHPALNVAKRSDTPLIVGNQLAKGQRKENDEVVPKHLEIIAGSAPIVVAGSKSALVHELVFQNTEAEFPGSDFVRQFVATCSHFIKTSELVHELEHYCQIIQPDIEEHKRYTDNLVSVISLLAEESSIKFSSSDVDILRRIVNKVWPTGGGEIGGAQDGATSTTATELLRVLDRVPVSESKAVKQRLSSSVDKNGSSSSFGNSARQLSLDSAAPKRSSAEPPKRATPPPPPLPSSKLHPEHPLSNIEELSRLSLTGLTPTILMKIQPQEIARQLYFYHDRVYRRFRLTSHSQLYGMSQHKQQGQTPQPLLASIAEPHFLTRLVHHHLLIDVPADRPGRRGMLLLYWVRVGEACRAIGDATSWASIAIAVTNPAIARLRETWQNIPLPWKMLIVREWVPRLIPYGLYSADLGELTPKTLTTQPLRVAPDAAHSHIFSSIPYFGPIKQSVQRAGHLAYHHAKTMISNNHQYRWPAATGPNHIIFLQYAHMYELANSAIKSFADSWAPCNDEASRQASTSRLEIGGNMPGGQASSSMSPTQSMSKHSLYPHSDLQKFFEHLNASPPLIGYKETKDQRPGQYDVQYLLSLSLKCEPAMSEQYHQTTYYQMAGGIKSTSQQVSLDQDIRAAPNSILPLVCPEIVPSTNVLQWIHPITRDEQSTTTFGTVPKHNPMPSDADPAPAPSVLSPDAATIGLSSNTEARSGTGRWTITHKRSRSFPDAATSVVIASEDEPRDPTEAQTESTSCDGDNGGGGGSSSSSSSAGDKLSSAAVSPTTPGTASSLRLSSGMSPHLSKTEQDRYNSLVGSILYAANGELALRVLRIQYARSQKPRVPQEPFGFLVEVQGGALAVLMDLLINDIKKYEGSVTDVDRNPVRMADGRPPHLTLNHSYAYRQAFLSSYRGFCAGQDLIAFLRIALRSLEKKNDVTVPLEQRMPALTHVLGRIIDFCSDWITYYLEDFLEDLSLREALSALLGAVMQVIRKQRKSIQLDTELDENARGKHVAALEALLSRVAELIPQFIFNLLSPSGYSPMDITLERQLKRALKCEREEGRSTIVVSRRPLDDLARLSPRDTLVTLNRLVQTHFARCTLYDWMMTYCLLEVQTHAPLPWYPVRRPRPNPSEDDLIISDIYRVLYQTVSKNYPERGSMMLAGVGSVATSSALLTATATPSISTTNLSNSGTAGYATGAAGLAPGKASEGGPNQAIPAPAISGSGSSPRASLWEQLPNAIKVLLDLHRIIRHWVTRQVSDPDIDIEERVARISKFIQIIRMCRFSKNESGSHAFKDALDAYLGRIKSLPMVTTLDLPENVTASTAAGTTKHASVSSTTASAQARPSHYVPSFVERAIASGLVSPESRRFVRAWNLVAFENGTAMGSLDALLQFPEYPPMPGMETKQDSLHVSGSDEDGNNAALPSFAVKEFNVPCVGWLLENMISLCYDTPDRLPNDERLINMAKRQRMHILTSVCDQMTVRCQKNFTLPTPLRLDLTQLAGYLIKEPLQYDAIRHAATKENSGPPEHELCSPRASKSRGSQSTDVSKPSSSSVFRRQSGASTSENSAVTVHARSYHGSPAGQWTSSHHNHHSLELSYLERPFSRLVADELEKVRQEHVERDNLERLIREREMELDRQTQERNKLLRRQLKEDKQRRARNETLVKMSTLMSRVNLTDGADGSTAASRRRRTEFISGSLHNGNTAGGRKSTSSASVKPALVINLINSVINAKEDYTKRDFVFHIVTEEGGEYLLQAPSEAEMELWIEAMRDAAAEAAARRLTVFVEEANSRSGYPAAYSDAPDGALLMGDALATATSSPVSPASNALAITPVDPVFGVPIEKLMPDPDVVPRFFEKCLAEIEKRGLDEVGIYRVSGSASGVNRLRMRLNQNSQSVDLSLPEYADINVVSGVVKLFLRELPEPLLTFDLYESLIEAINTENYDDRMWALKDTIHRLPKTNYTLLKRLIEHLEKVTDFEQINHMYSTNLALVFGPSLLRPPPSSSSFAHAMSNLGQAQSIVKNLILQYHWIFDIEQEVEASEDHDIADEVPAEADVGARPEKEEEEGSAGEANHGQPEKMSQRQSPQSVPSGDGLLKQQSGPHTAPTTIVQIGSGATEANVEGVVIPQPRNPTMTARQGGAPAGGEGCGDYSAESQTTAMSQPPEEVTHSPLHSTGSRSSTKSPKTASGALGASNAPSLTDESRTLGRMLRSKSMRRIRQAAATTASMFKPSSGNIDLKHYPLPLNTHTDDAALPNTSGFRPHSDQ